MGPGWPGFPVQAGLQILGGEEGPCLGCVTLWRPQHTVATCELWPCCLPGLSGSRGPLPVGSRPCSSLFSLMPASRVVLHVPSWPLTSPSVFLAPPCPVCSLFPCPRGPPAWPRAASRVTPWVPCPSLLLRRTLRSSFLLLLLVSASWLFGLLAVNHSVLAFHYLHAGLCGLQVRLVALSPRLTQLQGCSWAGIGSRRGAGLD